MTNSLSTFKLLPTALNNQELHTFADASLKAYGAVVYTQWGSQVSFVIAKATLSKFTLPCLYSCGSSGLTKFVFNSLDGLYHDIPVHLWSDSHIVLHWIGSQKKQKLQFVHIKSRKSLRLSQAQYGITVPLQTILNVVLEDPFWMQGPHWLTIAAQVQSAHWLENWPKNATSAQPFKTVHSVWLQGWGSSPYKKVERFEKTDLYSPTTILVKSQ